MWDRQFKRLGEILADDEKRSRYVGRIGKWIRRFVFFLVLVYALCLFAVPPLAEHIGEKNLSIAFALYLPRIIFLLPVVLLFPVVLLINWRLTPILVVASVFFLQKGMGWQFRTASVATPSIPGQSLNVMTYNRGQHGNKSLQPFKNATYPDIIAFQEAARRAARYGKAEGYEEFVAAEDAGEFTLLSRYPIISKELIEVPSSRRPLHPAARFVIDFQGTQVAVYVVHFESPRDTLLHYRRGAFLYGLIGVTGTPLAEKRRQYQAYWDDRIGQARKIAAIIEKDPLPTLVTGDFNAPSGGFIHGRFDKILTDAHPAAGSGFGYSFPGVTRNPLSGGGPWIRIDYLFCDSDWKVEWCITEPDRQSQHRAVIAQFHLSEKN